MLSSLRSELRELRKGHVKPVSRMLKHEVIMELEKLRGHQEKELKHEEKAVEKELVKAKVPRKVAEKVEEVQKAEHKKQVRKMKEEVEKKKSSPKKN